MDSYETFGSIVLLSLQVSGLAVLFSSLLGIPLGVWIGLSKFPGKRWVLILLHTGMALPPVVVGLLLYLLFSRTGFLGSLGWLFTPQAMLVAQIVLTLPFVVGITQASVAAVPAELVFQLRAIGASAQQAQWAVVWEARQGILLAIATALGRSFSEVGAVWLVGGNIEGHSRVLTTAIVLETSKGNFGFALQLGMVLLAIAFLANWLILRLQGRPT